MSQIRLFFHLSEIVLKLPLTNLLYSQNGESCLLLQLLAAISSPVIALQVEFERARQVVEKKDEQLNASRRILEEQEDELLVSFVDRGGAFLYCVDSQSFGFETWVH